MAMRGSSVAWKTVAWVFILGGMVAAADEFTLVIRAGTHGGLPGTGLRNLRISAPRGVDRRLTFRARFAPSAAYLTASAANQGDWNKLMGISTEQIHKNSIRLGWRWLPAEGKIEVGYYGYTDGVRISHGLKKVALGEWVNVEVRLTNAFSTVTAGGSSFTVFRNPLRPLGLGAGIPVLTAVLQTAYFGGDEVAPHTMAINV
ncbi:MAG: hypothetical protein HZA54_19195, partial [Planctomycetes bacterium]|nr:hypothetical protein [Planctomycetota bacterium]